MYLRRYNHRLSIGTVAYPDICLKKMLVFLQIMVKIAFIWRKYGDLCDLLKKNGALLQKKDAFQRLSLVRVSKLLGTSPVQYLL